MPLFLDTLYNSPDPDPEPGASSVAMVSTVKVVVSSTDSIVDGIVVISGASVVTIVDSSQVSPSKPSKHRQIPSKHVP